MIAAMDARSWDANYAGDPPWEIGRPQPVIVELGESGVLTGQVLDVGCGTGENTILIAAQGTDVLGIDLSPLAIETARTKAAERGSSARFAVGDALALRDAW
jgi:2-polyprenyl-3-methyl-5-hydroxy-6-metoxy-1,4-benzoquinol methylase